LLRVLIAGCVLAAVGVGVWFLVDDDEQSVPEQLGELFKPECEEGGSNGTYSGIDPASPRIIGFLDKWQGAAFQAVVEKRALEASVMGCEAAGGGIMYFAFTSRRAAERAAGEHRDGSVCLLGRGLFDDDFAEDQLIRFCEQLDGEVVQ
jgi:hypothetical protein